MTTQKTDPYTSPQSDVGVADSAEYADAKVFSFSGRIGRLRYLAYSMGLMLVSWLIIGILGAMMIPAMAEQGSESVGIVSIVLLSVAYIFMLVASFTLAVRRLNDFDKSGWMSLLLLVPLLNIILGFALFLVPGTQGENQYGAQPQPNNGGVIFFALLMPIFIGIMAAVAIPTYQQYVERAAQMQSQ